MIAYNVEIRNLMFININVIIFNEKTKNLMNYENLKINQQTLNLILNNTIKYPIRKT